MPSPPENIQQEPSAVSRIAARAMRDMFVALLEEGFSSSEALVIVGHVIATGYNKDG